MSVVKHVLRLPLLLIWNLTACVTSASASASASDWGLSGYLKSYGVVQESVLLNGADIAPAQAQLQNSVRLMLSSQTENGHDVEIHYETQPVFHSEKSALSGNVYISKKEHYRIDDLPETVLSDDDLSTYQNLDRLNIQYHLQDGDLTIGRQALAFGSARMVNPSDVFIPYDLQALNTEYRFGIDAIRYQHYVTDFVYVDAGLIAGRNMNSENNAAFMRTHYSVNGHDLDFMIIQQQNSYLFSAGLQRAIGELGSWLETAYLDSRLGSYWRTSLGIEYAFNEHVFTMIEYHYNGAGSSDAHAYLVNAQTEPYDRFGVYLLGKHYLMPSLSVTAGPLVTVGASVVWNVADDSSLLSVTAEKSWSENQYSQFGMSQGLGNELSGTADALLMESEFGGAPLMIYASYGVYF